MLDAAPDTSLTSTLTPPAKLASAYRNATALDPLPWAFWLLAWRLVHKVKSVCLAALFHAPGLFLGPRCLVRGSKFIKFGTGVFATSDLWLEAVPFYHQRRFSPNIVIGDGVSFSDGVHISCIERIVVGNGVLMGSHIYISDHNHGVYKGDGQSLPSESPKHRELGGGGAVVIGDNVWIGDNVVILGPANIGAGAILAANSVVRGSVPAETIVGGVPARILKQFLSSSGTWEKA
jgi:acetyltransferase-like isoleucine patch superfamily enzyme